MVSLAADLLPVAVDAPVDDFGSGSFSPVKPLLEGLLGSGSNAPRPLPFVRGRLAAGSLAELEASSLARFGFGRSSTNFLGPEAAVLAFVFGGGTLGPFELLVLLVIAGDTPSDGVGRFKPVEADETGATLLLDGSGRGTALVDALGGGRLSGMMG